METHGNCVKHNYPFSVKSKQAVNNTWSNVAKYLNNNKLFMEQNVNCKPSIKMVNSCFVM